MESLDGHRARILYIVEISDNQLVMGSEDGKLIVWDLNNYSLIKILHEHTGSITCLYYSEKLNSLFSASKDKTLLKWDINEWHCISLRGHENDIYTMVELNDKNIVTAGYNSGYFGGTNIHVWDID